MILARTVPAKLYVRIFSLVGEIYKAVAKVVFVAEICQRGNFTKAPGLTFQTYNKIRNLSTGHYAGTVLANIIGTYMNEYNIWYILTDTFSAFIPPKP
jgi:hypothetical protein